MYHIIYTRLPYQLLIKISTAVHYNNKNSNSKITCPYSPKSAWPAVMIGWLYVNRYVLTVMLGFLCEIRTPAKHCGTVFFFSRSAKGKLKNSTWTFCIVNTNSCVDVLSVDVYKLLSSFLPFISPPLVVSPFFFHWRLYKVPTETN